MRRELQVSELNSIFFNTLLELNVIFLNKNKQSPYYLLSGNYPRHIKQGIKRVSNALKTEKR